MATEAKRAYMREWYRRNRERHLARQKAWYVAHREECIRLMRDYRRSLPKAERERREKVIRKRGERRDYMRQWWAKTKASNPERHLHHVTRSNKTRATAGVPREIREMREVLYEYRSALLRRGKAA